MNNFSDKNNKDKCCYLTISNNKTDIYYDYDSIIKRILFEKSLIKKVSNKIGVLLLSSKGMILVLSFLLSFVLDFIWGDYNSQKDFTVAYYLGLGFLLSVSILIPAIFYLKHRDFSRIISDKLLFNKINIGYLFSLFFFGVSLCIILNILTYIFGLFMSLFGVEISNPSEIYSNFPLPIFLMIFVNSIIPALFEEFLFRGVILSSLRRFGDFFAILVSSVLFCIMHNSLIQIPFSLLVGLVLGYMVIKTNSLVPAMLVHFGNNFISCLMDIVSNNVNEVGSSIVFFIIICVFIILGIFSMLYLSHYTDFFTLNMCTNKLSFKDKMVCFISSPTIISFIILDILVLIFI